MLMSATMNADVERLQKLVLHNPVTLNLLATGNPDKAGPGPGSAAEIEHFSIATDRCIALMYLCAWVTQQLKPLFFFTVSKGVKGRGASAHESTNACPVAHRAAGIPHSNGHTVLRTANRVLGRSLHAPPS